MSRLTIRSDLFRCEFNDEIPNQNDPTLLVLSIRLAAGVINVFGASCVAKMRGMMLPLSLLLAGAGVINGERACL